MIKGVQVGLIVLAILAIVGGLAAVRFARTTSTQRQDDAGAEELNFPRTNPRRVAIRPVRAFPNLTFERPAFLAAPRTGPTGCSCWN